MAVVIDGVTFGDDLGKIQLNRATKALKKLVGVGSVTKMVRDGQVVAHRYALGRRLLNDACKIALADLIERLSPVTRTNLKYFESAVKRAMVAVEIDQPVVIEESR